MLHRCIQYTIIPTYICVTMNICAIMQMPANASMYSDELLYNAYTHACVCPHITYMNA